MPNGSQVAGGLDAIRDAIQMYLGLKQQRFQNDRMLAGDRRADEQLGIQRQAGADASRTSHQKFLTDFASKFGDATTLEGDDPLVSEYRQYGMGSALEPEEEAVQQIGDRQLTGGVLPINTPTQPTGRFNLIQPDDDKMQAALLRAQTSYYNTNARVGAQMRGQDITAATAAAGQANQATIASKRMAVQQTIANNANALRRYGIDVSSADRARVLEQLIDQNTAHFNDVQNDNFAQQLRSNPLALLPYLTGQQDMPDPVTPNYFSPPPNPGGPASTPRSGAGGQTRYPEIR